MGKFIITNALSLNMMMSATKLICVPVSVERAKKTIARHIAAGDDIVSAVGHADTARIISDMLGVDLPANRIAVNLDVTELGSDSIIIAQYTGPRLPEGATTLPDGAEIKFWIVNFSPAHEGWDYVFASDVEENEDPLVAIRQDGGSNFDSISLREDDEDAEF